MAKEVTFNLADLQRLIAEGVAQALAAKGKSTAVPASKAGLDGKSERSIKNEIAVVRAFKKAGFGEVKPHVDVMTFNRWVAAGFRPKEGTKSLKVKNLRLFHKSQVRSITAEEKSALAESQKAAVERHTAKQNGENVVPMVQ